jgi:hypothetical protein
VTVGVTPYARAEPDVAAAVADVRPVREVSRPSLQSHTSRPECTSRGRRGAQLIEPNLERGVLLEHPLAGLERGPRDRHRRYRLTRRQKSMPMLHVVDRRANRIALRGAA